MIVLDTHTLLWMDRNDEALGATARASIEAAWKADTVAVSAISYWEVAILTQRGRVALPVTVDAWRTDLLQAGIRELPVDGGLALLSTTLAGLHRDPADRFIVASALRHNATLITADAQILRWPGQLERLDARR